MDYKVITSSSPEQLTTRVNEYIKEGWKPVGGHSVVETKRQNRFSGQQHIDTLIHSEYSQTITKE
jgi:hypothetical protein